MYGDVVVNSRVRVDEGCPVRCDVSGSGVTNIVFGLGADAFEFVMEADALREFLKVGTEALDKMDALFAQEEAERDQQG